MVQEKKVISRRDMIKATGLVTILGLTYSKPFVETIRAEPAFRGYGRNYGSQGNKGVEKGLNPQPPGTPPVKHKAGKSR